MIPGLIIWEAEITLPKIEAGADTACHDMLNRSQA
jgi:hypothetical protein